MTATFNQELQRLLQLMTSLHFYPDNYFWSDKLLISRRTVKVECILSHQKKRLVKEYLLNNLSTNIDAKNIVYSLSAKAAESFTDEVDKFMNYPDTIDGDSILIVADLESDWKFVLACEFTKKHDNVQSLLDKNIYYPRILCATNGCIGAGLDSDDVVLVIQDGFPSCLLDLIQEMSQIGRGKYNDDSSPTDTFVLIMN